MMDKLSNSAANISSSGATFRRWWPRVSRFLVLVLRFRFIAGTDRGSTTPQPPPGAEEASVASPFVAPPRCQFGSSEVSRPILLIPAAPDRVLVSWRLDRKSVV